MERRTGTTSRGIRCPIIREGDDLAEIVTRSVLEAADCEGFEIREPLIEKKYERTVFGALQRCHQTNMMVRVLCRENLSVPMKNLFLNEIV